jgi:hypothetical protein
MQKRIRLPYLTLIIYMIWYVQSGSAQGSFMSFFCFSDFFRHARLKAPDDLGGKATQSLYGLLVVDSMISFRDPVRVIQFATRSRSRIVRSFSRVSGSTNSTESDWLSWEPCDSPLPETRLNRERLLHVQSSFRWIDSAETRLNWEESFTNRMFVQPGFR